MLVNSSLTVYHKGFDEEKRIETWTRYNYKKIWWHGGKGASINKGYENANDVAIRIPYDVNPNLDITNFKIGDIIIQGTLEFDIQTQQDLNDYEAYNIKSITNNTYGPNKHIHIGGK